MLRLSRRTGETIVCTLEDGRTIMFLIEGVQGNQVRLGIDAPKSISIDRYEVYLRKKREQSPEEPDGNV